MCAVILRLSFFPRLGPLHWSPCSHSTSATYPCLFRCTPRIRNCTSHASTSFKFSPYVSNKCDARQVKPCFFDPCSLFTPWTHFRFWLESVFLGSSATFWQSTMCFPQIRKTMATWPVLISRGMSLARLPGSLSHIQVRKTLTAFQG